MNQETNPLPRPRKKGEKGRATEQDALVGRRLRVARLAAGVTQQRLAEEMGVSFQAVQKYESGENRLSVGRLRRAIALLGRPVSFFFESGDEAHPVAQELTPQETQLIRNFRMVDEPLRKNIVELTSQLQRRRSTPGDRDPR